MGLNCELIQRIHYVKEKAGEAVMAEIGFFIWRAWKLKISNKAESCTHNQHFAVMTAKSTCKIFALSITKLNVCIIQLYWNLWHKLLPTTAMNAFGSLQHIPPGNWLYQKPAHHQVTSILLPSLFVVQHFLSRWDTTSFYTSNGTTGGTIVLDLQSSSCVHCQLFPTHSNGPVAQPFSTGVRNQPPAKTQAEANRGTCLHQLN